MKHEEADVTIIGSGPAGLQAGKILLSLGNRVLILEKESRPGGKLLIWDSLFQPGEEPKKLLAMLMGGLAPNIRTSEEVISHSWSGGIHRLVCSSGHSFSSDALILATGFRPFDASLKEEYGYMIYKNVITSVELENMFSRGKVTTKRGDIPARVAMVHCVGSRDLKTGNEYCSSVCCITGIKQSNKLCTMYPGIRVSHLYMDLRLGGRLNEYCYKEAQMKHRVHFIRGRLSETNPGRDDSLVIRYEDTLAGKPASMTVDLLVLLVGMVPEPLKCFDEKLIRGADGFCGNGSFDNRFCKEESPGSGSSASPPALTSLFCAGACTGPKNLVQSIHEASATAWEANNYIKSIQDFERKEQRHRIWI